MKYLRIPDLRIEMGAPASKTCKRKCNCRSFDYALYPSDEDLSPGDTGCASLLMNKKG
jgi:hypothetical protein